MNEVVTGVIRWKMRLDWILTGFFHGNFTKAETNVRNCLRVALYQIMFLNRVPHAAAVDEAVEFIKKLRGQKTADLVNAILRNIVRNLENLRYPEYDQDQIKHLAVTESHPEWMVRRWIERFGFDETKKLLISNNRRPDLTIRVNRTKIDFNYFTNLLTQNNVEFVRSEYLDYFIRVKNLSDIGNSELFRQGFFSIQDESAGLVVVLLDPKPGERVIDLCSAPGGKATFIGELMNNIGEIIAVDKYESRLNVVRSACARLGIANAHFVVSDASEVKIPPADKVLADVPCSGLGVLAKKPDAKWKREEKDIITLSGIQRKILENASRLTKAGGVLVYSTCTIEYDENMGIINKFLEDHSDFSIEEARLFVKGDIMNNNQYVETFPQRHLMDGSFSVRLKRRMS
jgi:16S rRNA (cytosine967-C5)-methyltransferase